MNASILQLQKATQERESQRSQAAAAAENDLALLDLEYRRELEVAAALHGEMEAHLAWTELQLANQDVELQRVLRERGEERAELVELRASQSEANSELDGVVYRFVEWRREIGERHHYALFKELILLVEWADGKAKRVAQCEAGSPQGNGCFSPPAVALDEAFLELVYRLHSLLKQAVPPRGARREPVLCNDPGNELRLKANRVLARKLPAPPG